MVIVMMQVFSTFVYSLLNQGSTFSFLTPLLTLNFAKLPEVLHDPVVVSTPLRENVRTNRVHKDFLIVVGGKTMYANFVELPMHNFDVILCMDRIHTCYACLDCCCSVVRFSFPNDEELVWEGYIWSRPNLLMSYLNANKMMSKGLLCHILSVNDLDHDIPSIDSVPVVKEFLDVFPDCLPKLHPPRDIDFGIDLEPDTKTISVPPYRMAPAELKELKL